MASIETRQRERADGTDGQKTYRVTWRDLDGRQRSKSFDKWKLANSFKSNIEVELLRGTYVDPHDKTTVAEQFAYTAGVRNWRDSTREAREGQFNRHIKERFGKRKLSTIRRTELRQWVADMLASGLAPGTAKNAYELMSTMLRLATVDGLIPLNPATDITVPVDEDGGRIVIPTVEDVHRLAQDFGPYHSPMALVGAGTGMRTSEVCGLTIGQIDFLRREILVDRQIVGDGSKARFGPPKTRKSVRIIPVPATLIEVLSVHVRDHELGPDGVLWHNDGRLMWRRNVATKVRSSGAVEKFHHLRHFYASLLIAQGHNVKEIQERLGHASATTTWDIYGHLWPTSDEATRESVERILFAAV